jgi:large subunit ribosomal protein L29
MKAKELREMSGEQLDVEIQQAVQGLFRLRIKSQSDSQNASSEMRRQRKLIARIKTIQRERELAAAAKTEAVKA